MRSLFEFDLARANVVSLPDPGFGNHLDVSTVMIYVSLSTHCYPFFYRIVILHPQ